MKCGAPLAPVESTVVEAAAPAQPPRPEAQKLFKPAPLPVERYCPKCGASNDEGAEYCVSCRRSLREGFFEPKQYDSTGSMYGRVSVAPAYVEPETIPHPHLPESYDGLGAIISKAFGIYSANLGVVLGAYWVMYLVIFAAAFVCALFSMIIPFAGNIIQIAITPLFVGVYYVNLRTVRGHVADLGEAFSCLSEKYVPMLIATIIQTLLLIVPVFAVMFAVFGSTFYRLMSMGPGSQPPDDWETLSGMIGGIVVAGLLMALLQMFFVFVYPLIADDETDFWRAITTSVKFVWYNFWEVFAMMFVAGLIAVAGVLALGIGLIFTTPLMFLIETAYYVARRDRFLALR